MVLTNTLRHNDEGYDTFVRRVQTWDFFSPRRRDSVALSTGTSILIMMAGMLVPVLAAAPFYIADRRRDAESAQAETEPEKPDAEIHVLRPATRDESAGGPEQAAA